MDTFPLQTLFRRAALAILLLVGVFALPACFASADPGTDENVPAGGDVAESGAPLRLPRLRSLAVTPREARVAPGATQAFTATATFSNGALRDVTALVTWRSSNGSVATISNALRSKGVATGQSAGQAIITAHLLGHSAMANLTVASPAALVAITVSPSSPVIANGTTQQFTATGLYSDASIVDLTAQVTWASSDTTVAAINSTGLAFGFGVGTTTIFATFAAVTGAATLTVSAAVLVAIQVVPTNVSIGAGAAQQFVAVGTYSDGSTADLTWIAAWSSSDEVVASFADFFPNAGLLFARAPGSTIIAATLDGVTGTTTLTVTPAQLAAITVVPSNASIPVGTSQAYAAIGTYTDGSVADITSVVTWASSDETKAIVIDDPAGLRVLGLSVGSVTIVAQLGPILGTTTLTVTPDVTPAVLISISVVPNDPTVPIGGALQFVATGLYSDGSLVNLTSSVTWSSSNEAVATIDNVAAQGLATASAPGTTTITATLLGVTGATTLTVTPAILVAIAVTPVNASIPLGFAQAFTAVGIYSDGSVQDVTAVVTWTSSDAVTAVISNDPATAGQAFGLSTGTAVIGASLGPIVGTTTLTVTPAILTSIVVLPVLRAAPVGTTLQFVAVGSYSDGSTLDLTTIATWASSDTTVATIDDSAASKALALAVSPGTTDISATVGFVSGSTALSVTP